MAGVLVEVSAFAALALSALTRPDGQPRLATQQHWRNVAGVGLIFMIGAVLAVAVALLVRQTAGTMAVLLVYPLLGERLLKALPGIGPGLYHWLPFNLANHFLTGGVVDAQPGAPGVGLSETTLTPWWALAYYATLSLALLVLALVVAQRRDA